MKKIFSNKKKRKKRKSKNISTTMKRKFIIEKCKKKQLKSMNGTEIRAIDLLLVAAVKL